MYFAPIWFGKDVGAAKAIDDTPHSSGYPVWKLYEYFESLKWNLNGSKPWDDHAPPAGDPSWLREERYDRSLCT